MPGVTIEDMGYKMGLNGVDNAKLSFDNVRVPREALLNRWSDVAEVRHNHESALFLITTVSHSLLVPDLDLDSFPDPYLGKFFPMF
jgi:hypothetical protein